MNPFYTSNPFEASKEEWQKADESQESRQVAPLHPQHVASLPSAPPGAAAAAVAAVTSLLGSVVPRSIATGNELALLSSTLTGCPTHPAPDQSVAAALTTLAASLAARQPGHNNGSSVCLLEHGRLAAVGRGATAERAESEVFDESRAMRVYSQEGQEIVSVVNGPWHRHADCYGNTPTMYVMRSLPTSIDSAGHFPVPVPTSGHITASVPPHDVATTVPPTVSVSSANDSSPPIPSTSPHVSISCGNIACPSSTNCLVGSLLMTILVAFLVFCIYFVTR